MKIEQLLVQHLYNNKSLSLQGIGTFRLADSVALPAENDKDFAIPADGISFTYDPKTTEDEALIDFIVQQTRKIKPLASADLDSYIMLSKQFLNIGKPLRIEGIGTLLKAQNGHYDFTPGQYITPKIEPSVKPLKEKLEGDVSFTTPTERRSVNGKKWALIIGVLLVLGGGGYATWWYFTHKEAKPDNTVVVEPKTERPTVPDSTINQPVSTKPADSLLATTPKPADPNAPLFKIVFLITKNKGEAISRMNTQIGRGHKVIMYTSDSITYKVAEPFTLPLSDTLRVKDSLAKWYYGKKVFVETN